MEKNGLPAGRGARRRGLRLALTAGFSLGSLYLALRGAAPGEIWAALQGARGEYVALAFGSVLANALAKTLRWRVLLGENGGGVPFSRLFAALFAGQLLNVFLPGRVGDLGRAYVVGGLGPGRTFTLGTIVVEKVLDLLAYAVLVLVLVVLLPLPGWVSGSAYSLVWIAVLVAAGLFITARFQQPVLRLLTRLGERLPAGLRALVVPRLQAGLSSFESLYQPTSMARLVGWSGVVWGTALLNNELTLRAVGLRLPVTASVLLLVALQAGISLSNVPGTIGVFEYLVVLGLAVFGVDQGDALPAGLLLHAVVLLPMLVGGGLSLLVLGAVGAPMPVREQE